MNIPQVKKLSAGPVNHIKKPIGQLLFNPGNSVANATSFGHSASITQRTRQYLYFLS
jgi:hypothetical protein